MSAHLVNFIAALFGGGAFTVLALHILIPSIGAWGLALAWLIGGTVAYIGLEFLAVLHAIPRAARIAGPALFDGAGNLMRGCLAFIRLPRPFLWLTFVCVGATTTAGWMINSDDWMVLPLHHRAVNIAVMIFSGAVGTNILLGMMGIFVSNSSRLSHRMLRTDPFDPADLLVEEDFRSQKVANWPPWSDHSIPMLLAVSWRTALLVTLRSLFHLLVLLPISVVLVTLDLVRKGSWFMTRWIGCFIPAVFRLIHSQTRLVIFIDAPLGGLMTYLVLRAIGIPIGRTGGLAGFALLACCALGGLVATGIGLMSHRILTARLRNQISA